MLVSHSILTEPPDSPDLREMHHFSPQSGSLSNFHLTNSKVSAMLVGGSVETLASERQEADIDAVSPDRNECKARYS